MGKNRKYEMSYPPDLTDARILALSSITSLIKTKKIMLSKAYSGLLEQSLPLSS